jgi:hypothetical protein
MSYSLSGSNLRTENRNDSFYPYHGRSRLPVARSSCDSVPLCCIPCGSRFAVVPVELSLENWLSQIVRITVVCYPDGIEGVNYSSLCRQVSDDCSPDRVRIATRARWDNQDQGRAMDRNSDALPGASGELIDERDAVDYRPEDGWRPGRAGYRFREESGSHHRAWCAQ